MSISTNADGVIVWKVEPGRINELILELRNADDPADQKKDYRGRDLGIVLRSVEFLKNDVDFEMTGQNCLILKIITFSSFFAIAFSQMDYMTPINTNKLFPMWDVLSSWINRVH